MSLARAKFVLRLHHFDVVGDTGLKAVARLFHFLAGEIDAEVGDIHFAARAGQLGRSPSSLPARCGCELLLLLLQLADREFGLGALGLDAAAGEERHVDVGLVVCRPGWRCSELSPCCAQKPLAEIRGSRASAAARNSSCGALLLDSEPVSVRAGSAGALERLIDVDVGSIEEARP